MCKGGFGVWIWEQVRALGGYAEAESERGQPELGGEVGPRRRPCVAV